MANVILAAHRRTDLVLVFVGVIVGLCAGLALTKGPGGGLFFVGGCLLLIVISTRPAALAVLALLASFAAYRLGSGSVAGGSSGVSYADAFLGLAMAIGVPSLLVGPEIRRLRPVLIGLAIYLVCLLPTVLLDDSNRGAAEWFHRLLLVGGATVVGAWLAREGLMRLSLRIFLVLAVALSIATIAVSFQSGFAPVYPLGLHKNFAGAQLSMALVLVVAARSEIGLKQRTRISAAIVISGGLIATQSRGSMIAAAVGILLVASFAPNAQSRQVRGLVALVSLVLAGFVFFSIRAQLNLDQQDLDNSSIGVRQKVEARAQEIWRSSPVRGVGLKYFNSGEFGGLAAPPNIVVDNELAESGIIGLVGFGVLQIAAISTAIRRRRENHFATVGAACVAGLLAHGMVDIYWIAGSASLPFILLGMGVGGEALDRDKGNNPAPDSRRGPLVAGSRP